MTILLSMEHSTDNPGIAVLDGSAVLAERCWTACRERSRMFDFIICALKSLRMSLDDIETFVTGLGPGSYMGLRISLAAARAFALPDSRPVYGVNSAEALALSIREEFTCGAVVVIGDARRGHLWIARFCEDQSDSGIRTLKLIGPDELSGFCPPGTVCVTADWERIGTLLEQSVPDSVFLVREKRVPSASALGRLASYRIKHAIPSERLEPIYMHPAVARQASSIPR